MVFSVGRVFASPAPVGSRIRRAGLPETASAHLPSGERARATPSPRRTAALAPAFLRNTDPLEVDDPSRVSSKRIVWPSLERSFAIDQSSQETSSSFFSPDR